MKISKRNLSRLIESLLSGSELEKSLKEKTFDEINSLAQKDKDLLDNYLESISPNLNVSNILSPEEEIPLEKNEFEQLNDLRINLSELIKSLLGKDEEHITGYIEEITPVLGKGKKEWFKDGKLHREGDKPALILYHRDGSIWIELWYKDGELHREGDKPAQIWYRENGSIREESWYKDGELHREGDKPAYIIYRKDGSISEAHWSKNGEYHREGDKPALIWYRKDGSIEEAHWHKNGIEYFPGEEL